MDTESNWFVGSMLEYLCYDESNVLSSRSMYLGKEKSNDTDKRISIEFNADPERNLFLPDFFYSNFKSTE